MGEGANLHGLQSQRRRAAFREGDGVHVGERGYNWGRGGQVMGRGVGGWAADALGSWPHVLTCKHCVTDTCYLLLL